MFWLMFIIKGGKSYCGIIKMVKTKLPKHLASLLDTPAKRKRANKIIKEAGLKEKRKMLKKGYYLKGNKYIKYKR